MDERGGGASIEERGGGASMLLVEFSVGISEGSSGLDEFEKSII